MKRCAAIIFAVFIFTFSLSSCFSGDKNISCRKILGEITKAEIGLPAGRYYSLTAKAGDDEYVSRALIASLFGSGHYPKLADDWLDLALYLSLGSHPCEFAVILCRDRDTAHDTATLLLSRLSSIKKTKTSPEYSRHLESAKVTIVGNYALLIISSDSENALKVARAAMK